MLCELLGALGADTTWLDSDEVTSIPAQVSAAWTQALGAVRARLCVVTDVDGSAQCRRHLVVDEGEPLRDYPETEYWVDHVLKVLAQGQLDVHWG